MTPQLGSHGCTVPRLYVRPASYPTADAGVLKNNTGDASAGYRIRQLRLRQHYTQARYIAADAVTGRSVTGGGGGAFDSYLSESVGAGVCDDVLVCLSLCIGTCANIFISIFCHENPCYVCSSTSIKLPRLPCVPMCLHSVGNTYMFRPVPRRTPSDCNVIRSVHPSPGRQKLGVAR